MHTEFPEGSDDQTARCQLELERLLDWFLPAAHAAIPAPPGGPILIITPASPSFGDYYAEILRAEGFKSVVAHGPPPPQDCRAQPQPHAEGDQDDRDSPEHPGQRQLEQR